MASNPDALAALNSATLGAQMPTIALASGEKVQTGTVGALLLNIKAYDSLLASRSGREEDEDAEKFEAERRAIEDKFRLTAPLLSKVGFFDIFPTEDWIAGGEARSAGRRRAGEIFREMGY